MKRRNRVIPVFTLFVTFISMTASRSAFCDQAKIHAVFANSNGEVIELDTQSGLLRAPHSRGALLRDCSDKLQTCLTDQRGFAFAYFNKCNDALAYNYKLLKFPPKIVSVLHNDLWIVFDASPNYMFHYVTPMGIMGIYVGSTPTFDFRSLFHNSALKIANLEAMEYHLKSEEAVAPCIE